MTIIIIQSRHTRLVPFYTQQTTSFIHGAQLSNAENSDVS